MPSPFRVPDISVVLPACERVDLLDRCLEALVRQTLQADRYEVIVVDTDPACSARKLVAVWQAGTHGRGPTLRYLAGNGPGALTAALNRGWRAARGALVAFTGEEGVPAAGWLQHALAAFDKHTAAALGRVETSLPAAPTAHQRDVQRHAGSGCVATNLVCRKAVLAALCGFDERFRAGWRADSDLHFRLLAMRARVVRAPAAVVALPPPPARWGASLRELRKFHVDALLYKKHPRQYRRRIAAPPRRLYYGCVLALLVVLAGRLGDWHALALTGMALWCAGTALLLLQGLRGTSRRPTHLVEALVTAALTPPLAVYWRLHGALRHRVRFA
jgi:glycosyltransferase involved in cell wall biosynthesis